MWQENIQNYCDKYFYNSNELPVAQHNSIKAKNDAHKKIIIEYKTL